MRLALFVLFTFGLTLSSFATEVESLGHFRFYDFALSPRLRLAEPGEGGFELAQSWIGFEWSRDEWIRGVLKLGSKDLTTPVIWNSPQSSASFGVSEAWMEGRSLIGDVRAGLIVIPTGFESLNEDQSSVFPETRARHHNWFIKRDMGLQFLWQTHFWDTSIALHNGESGDNKDGKYWVTGHWQYRDSDGTGVLFTGSVGQTKAASTATSTAAAAVNGFVFDPAADAKIRQGGIALYKAIRRNLILLEASSGEVLQNGAHNSFGWAHLDWVYNNGGDVSFLTRFEQDQPRMSDQDSIVRSYGAGIEFSSKENLQSLTLFANHLDENGGSIASDELWLLFRIHSFVIP